METIDGRFIDCQFETPLFKSMGGRQISYDEYMKDAVGGYAELEDGQIFNFLSQKFGKFR